MVNLYSGVSAGVGRLAALYRRVGCRATGLVAAAAVWQIKRELFSPLAWHGF